MKKIIILSLLAFSILPGCKEDCVQDAKCSEQPETGGTCLAYFENWIYNPDSEECEFKGYSGCSPIGFDTEAECEKCDCDD